MGARFYRPHFSKSSLLADFGILIWGQSRQSTLEWSRGTCLQIYDVLISFDKKCTFWFFLVQFDRNTKTVRCKGIPYAFCTFFKIFPFRRFWDWPLGGKKPKPTRYSDGFPQNSWTLPKFLDSIPKFNESIIFPGLCLYQNSMDLSYFLAFAKLHGQQNC